MAFYAKTVTGRTAEWHVPSDKPKIISPLTLLTADGDELEHIRYRFSNIPICHRVCTWQGEMANFIYNNLQ